MNYLDLTLQEFLDVITDAPITYKLKITSLEGEYEGVGSYDDLVETLLDINFPDGDREKHLYSLQKLREKEYEKPLSEIEIYNYLDKVTSNFDFTKTRIAWNDIAVYYDMVFKERLHSESEDIYKKNKWEIPYIKYNIPGLIENGCIPDYKEMLKKTHLFDSWNINYARKVLTDKFPESELNRFSGINKMHQAKKSESKVVSFETFVSPEKQTYILQLLENLSVTTNGKSILSERKKSAIRGVIEALIEKGIVPNLSYESLYKILGNKIGLKIKTKLDASSTSEDMKTKTLQYIKNNPFN